MLTPLLDAFPRTVRPLLEELDDTLPPTNDAPIPLSEIIHKGPGPVLTATENAQPAILFTSLAILRVLQENFDFPKQHNVDFYLGHSLGEFTALVAAGMISLSDALRLVRRRGEVMRDSARRVSVPEMEGGPGETGMVALLVQENYMSTLQRSIKEFLHSETLPNDEFLSIANINSRTQVVLSGHLKAINACLCHVRKWSGQDPRALRLNVSAPFHCAVMAPSCSVVREMLDQMLIDWSALEENKCEVVANVTARPYENVEQMKDVVARQGMETVRWLESIQYLDRERDVAHWIGLGPGKVGRNLVGKEVKGGMKRVVGIDGSDVKSIEAAMKQVEKLMSESN